MAEERSLRDEIVGALQKVFDPEIPVNIYDLGLIYEVEVGDSGEVGITMTLTSPMCPVAEWLPQDVQLKVEALEGVSTVNVEIVWDPPWSEDLMTEAAKLELGLF